MSTTRVFLLASALARLIEKERGGHLVRQGFFPEQPNRSAHVQVAGETGHLILVSQPSASPLEEPVEISRSQAEALLELTDGRIEYLSILHRHRLSQRRHPAVRRSGAARSDQLGIQSRQVSQKVPASGLVWS